MKKRFLLVVNDCNGTSYYFGDSFYQCLDKYVEFENDILMDNSNNFNTLFYEEWEGTFIELLDLEKEKEIDISDILSESLNKIELIYFCRHWDKEYLDLNK